MLFNVKLIVMVASLLLGTTGVALAATGVLPEVADEVATLIGVQEPDHGVRDDAYNPAGDEIDLIEDGKNAAHDLYGEHGEDVSLVAKDKDATGTMTLPNGMVIENHGLAVKEVATGHHEAARGEMEQPPAHEASGTEDCRQLEDAPAIPEGCDGYEYEDPAGNQDAASGNRAEGRR